MERSSKRMSNKIISKKSVIKNRVIKKKVAGQTSKMEYLPFKFIAHFLDKINKYLKNDTIINYFQILNIDPSKLANIADQRSKSGGIPMGPKFYRRIQKNN